MDTLLIKRARMELKNAKEIIQEQRKVIENQKAEIQELKEQLKNWELIAKETKIKNVPIPELPNETWLEIMSYSSTFDVLRNIARVSKRFLKLSEDPHVIRKIEVQSVQTWPKDKEEKYCDDFLRVLKRSLKLKKLSFGFHCSDNDNSGKKFLDTLPSLNHEFLQEFCLNGDGKKDYNIAAKFLTSFLRENIKIYLEKCPDLKIFKFEFQPELSEEHYGDYPAVSDMANVLSSFRLKNLEEFHLIGIDICDCQNHKFKEFLEGITISDNLPKLQRLCLTCQDVKNIWDEDCQTYASERNINIEISSVFKCGCGQQAPSCEKKIFGPR